MWRAILEYQVPGTYDVEYLERRGQYDTLAEALNFVNSVSSTEYIDRILIEKEANGS